MGSSKTNEMDDTLTLGSGVTVEKKSIVWKIDHFNMIMKEDAMINAQRIDFQAGDKVGFPSTWTVFLQKIADGDGERKWTGIFYKLKEEPANLGEYLYSQMQFSLKDSEGQTTWCAETSLKDVPSLDKGLGAVLVNDNDAIVGWETLEIHLTFTMCVPPRFQQPTVQTTLEKYQAQFAAQARIDLATLVKNPVVGSDLKLISNDKKEFIVPRGILSVRSPFFEALLSSDMSEANSGIIQLPDISGGGLEVLVNFFYTGELIPSWEESSVLVELTNAAAKYQLEDLLEFLDLTLGKVCDLNNVVQLFSLANHLSLKTAEEELLQFVRENGVSSPENFAQIVDVMSDININSLSI